MEAIDALLDIDAVLSERERTIRDRARALVDTEVRPRIADWWERGHVPTELLPALGEAGLLGLGIEGHGCPGGSAVEAGLAMQELEAGDSGVRTIVSVQGSLAMTAIARFGDDAQREAWLPRMARGAAIGALALTEPHSGSDPGSMRTTARRDGGDWVLDGAKRWIGLATVADVLVVWARTDEGVQGFLVPADAPGVTATPIEPKLSMRASVQCDVRLDGVRLPREAALPEARGLRAAFTCLDQARYGIAWGAMGAARDALEAVLALVGEREAFGRPLAGFQLTQARLADMAVSLSQGQLLALHLGRTKDARGLRPEQVSLGKLANVRAALAICREARALAGGDGITHAQPAMRHAANLESVRTYEGTDEVHQLVLGHALTGIAAFR
ncbi:acyl-CoA dehydrogenase family protein [Agrococcus terreus]|uniref:glutaryl-CoA dehydrogenase (ETF) n=1 Tax=Agrococcus terreus TaxID=574649 RepID=A0ABQ2KPX7_9MICO|nr:acyl-CoA dehydrogenase family protein [Agrococcus terreus]GGN88780.1 acyl-CoA dehydrogenase [Agrococcus terreus]